MCAFITDIATATPDHRIGQLEVLSFMKKAHNLNDEEFKRLQLLYRATGIQNRYSSIEDYRKAYGFTFFPENPTLDPFPGTDKRMKWYQKEALKTSLKAVRNLDKFKPSQITHLITVSCTGMYAPGLDIDLISALELAPSTERTAINFMGCYAAFNALKMANYISNQNENACILIVATELCSLHFQKEKTDDNLLANAIFGDGSAAVLVESAASNRGFEISSFNSTLIPKGEKDMAWSIGDLGFEMKLSAYVPDIISSHIGDYLDSLLNGEKFNHYAIHPGGKKILKAVEEALQISKEENSLSHDVLRDYGNMSSPTVLFILNRLLNETARNGDRVLGLGFGPGLTVETMTFKVNLE